MSAAQNAASPVAGWRHFGGATKLLLASTVLAGGLAALILPDLIWRGDHHADKTNKQEAAAVKPFEPPPPSPASKPSDAPGEKVSAATRVRRLPPPLEIGAYIVPRQVRQPAAAPASPAYVTQSGQAVGNAPPVQMLGGQGDSAEAASSPGSLASQVSGTTMLSASRATALAHPDFTITAGSKIPCLPVEASDSSLGGFYSCRVPEAVRGTTQRYRLLPPGTLIFGQVKRGMEHGQERLGIVFTRIQTAGDNFLIPLAAPGADAMGRPGLNGDVETFFWDKVGAVALYALIDGVQNAITGGAQAAIASASGGKGNSFTNLNFNGGGQSLASIALQNTINKPPVLRRDQALPMDVSLGQDLDFYDVCMARMRVNALACPAT